MFKAIIALILFCATGISAEPNVLLFSGSTRTGSLNKKLINEAAKIAQENGAQVTLIDFKEFRIPFYDGDLEDDQGMPFYAKKFRDLMIKSQIIVISTPDYNASISGVLKNALDWASRGEEGGESFEAFKGKTFVLLNATPSSRGKFKALSHLEVVIKKIGGTVSSANLSLRKAHQVFDDDGNLTASEQKAELKEIIESAIAQSGLTTQATK